MTLRTENSWSRTRAAALELQRLGGLVHLLLEPVEDRRGLAVEERDQLVDEGVYSSWSTAATHGATHFSMCA